MALGCAGIFLVFEAMEQVSPFEQTKHGVLTGFLPRTILYVLWAGETLAAIIGIGSFAFIRRQDITSSAIIGIVTRSILGIAIGIFGSLVLWLYVGHRVIGF